RPATPEPRKEPSASEPVRRPARKAGTRHYSVVAIGTSTGAPVALQKVLTALPASFPAPVVLVRRLPASCAAGVAARRDELCRVELRQAVDGGVRRPGLPLRAPGGKEMMVDGGGGQAKERRRTGDGRLNYPSCVEVSFGALAGSLP